MTRVLLSRLFHLERDLLSRATKIHYNLSRPRLASYTIYGASELQRTHNLHILSASLFYSFSFSLFFSFPFLIYCRAILGEWACNIISVHKNGISRRGSTERVFVREYLVVLNIADDERARSDTLHRARYRFRYSVIESAESEQKRATDYFVGGGEREVRERRDERSTGVRQTEITQCGKCRRGWMSNERGRAKAKWSRTLRNEIRR